MLITTPTSTHLKMLVIFLSQKIAKILGIVRNKKQNLLPNIQLIFLITKNSQNTNKKRRSGKAFHPCQLFSISRIKLHLVRAKLYIKLKWPTKIHHKKSIINILFLDQQNTISTKSQEITLRFCIKERKSRRKLCREADFQ